MQMNKYKFKKRILPLMGFLACVVCSMALLLIVNRQQEETAAVHPAQDILDNLASLMAVLKRTMERAPTIPREITMLLLIISIITQVTRAISTLILLKA